MADYSILGVKNGSINLGDASSNSAPSPFIRPSEIGAQRYLRCDFTVSIAVASDLSTFISINGGWIHEDTMPNDNQYFGWPKAFLAAAFEEIQFRAVLGTNDQFVIWSPSTGQKTYSFSNSSQWDEGWVAGDATVFYNNFGIGCPKGGGAAVSRVGWSDPNVDPSSYSTSFPTATSVSSYTFSGTHAQFVANMKAKGYTYIGQLGNAPWGEGEQSRTGYVYVGGLCLFNSSTAQDVAYWTTAAKIPIEGLRDFMEYYPWERRVSDVWYSLNKDGGQQTNTGLFRRINGAWSPCTNREGTSTTEDHGFRYNNGWQKSPKSGQGA